MWQDAVPPVPSYLVLYSLQGQGLSLRRRSAAAAPVLLTHAPVTVSRLALGSACMSSRPVPLPLVAPRLVQALLQLSQACLQLLLPPHVRLLVPLQLPLTL